MARPGPKTLAERTGEEIKTLKIMVTMSQYRFVMRHPMSASAFIRGLIDTAIKWREAEKSGADLSSFDLLKLSKWEVQRLIADGELSPEVDWEAWFDSYIDIAGIAERDDKED